MVATELVSHFMCQVVYHEEIAVEIEVGGEATSFIGGAYTTDTTGIAVIAGAVNEVTNIIISCTDYIGAGCLCL